MVDIRIFLVVVALVSLGCESMRDPATFGRVTQWPTLPDASPGALDHNNAVKRAVYNAFRTGGDYTAVLDVTTVEGDPVPTKLVVRQGRVTYIQDFRRDPLAGGAGIVTDEVGRLKLGWVKGEQFVEVEQEPPPPGKELFLQFSLPSRGEASF